MSDKEPLSCQTIRAIVNSSNTWHHHLLLVLSMKVHRIGVGSERAHTHTHSQRITNSVGRLGVDKLFVVRSALPDAALRMTGHASTIFHDTIGRQKYTHSICLYAVAPFEFMAN